MTACLVSSLGGRCLRLSFWSAYQLWLSLLLALLLLATITLHKIVHGSIQFKHMCTRFSPARAWDEANTHVIVHTK